MTSEEFCRGAMIRDLLHSLALGALHGLAYLGLLILGLWLVEPEIQEIQELFS